jgi:hypothetical protein
VSSTVFVWWKRDDQQRNDRDDQASAGNSRGSHEKEIAAASPVKTQISRAAHLSRQMRSARRIENQPI